MNVDYEVLSTLLTKLIWGNNYNVVLLTKQALLSPILIHVQYLILPLIYPEYYQCLPLYHVTGNII